MSETSVIAYMSGNAPAEVDATHPLPVTLNSAAAPGTVAYGALAPTTSAVSMLASAGTRSAVTLVNNGSAIVYLGSDNSLTVANGFPLNPGTSFTVQSTTAIWMVMASGTGDVRYWAERY